MALHVLLEALPAWGIEARVVALDGAAEAGPAASYQIRQVAASPRPWLTLLGNALAGSPPALARYRLPALAAAVAEELADFAPHVLHLEQLHTAWLLAAMTPDVPVLLRQQNVESRIFERLVPLRRGPMRALLRRESRRLAAAEAWACRRADLVATVSEVDATAMRGLAPGARVAVLPPPYAAGPPSAATTLAGAPPFLSLGVFDWVPNRDGARWLLREVWPRLRRRCPGAVLHVAGPGSTTLGVRGGKAVVCHGWVADARAMYDPRSVVLVPVRAGSGVRLRILEAWGAGVPVVATEVAAEGLVPGDGDGAVVVNGAQELADAAARVAVDPELRRKLVARGKERLVAHESSRVAGIARSLYETAIAHHAQARGLRANGVKRGS